MRLFEGIMNDKVEKYNIPYRVIRSSRRTISVQITLSGEVLVRCPQRMSNADIRRFVESKSDWIEKHLEKRTAAARLPVFTDEQLQMLARQARQTVPERVAYFAPLVGVTYGRITIRSQHTLWGSCSSKGNLNFNCLLIAGGAGLCGRPRAVPPEGNEPLRTLLGRGRACLTGL